MMSGRTWLAAFTRRSLPLKTVPPIIARHFEGQTITPSTLLNQNCARYRRITFHWRGAFLRTFFASFNEHVTKLPCWMTRVYLNAQKSAPWMEFQCNCMRALNIFFRRRAVINEFWKLPRCAPCLRPTILALKARLSPTLAYFNRSLYTSYCRAQTSPQESSST